MKNRSVLRIGQAWIIIGLSIIAVDSVAQCLDEVQTQRYASQNDFFVRSGTGVMAIMPNVKKQSEAKSEHTYMVFSESGTYRLEGDIARRNDFWFVINHRIVDSDRSNHTYLGVMIAKVLGRSLESQLELGPVHTDALPRQ